MSALAIEPTTTEGGPADAASASLRVQQLQTLLAQASSGPTTSFAEALTAASASPASSPAPAASPSPAVANTASNATYTPPATASPPASPASTAESAGSSTYDATIAQAAARYGIEPALLHGLIQQESGFDPNARSSSGALGLTQLMPGTASSLGVTDPLDPTQSIEGGARYLSEMLARFGGNTADALAAYNAGPGAVSQYGGVPPYAETQEYVNKVLGYADAYSQSPTVASTPGAIATQPAGAIATPATTPATGSIA